MSWAMIWGWLRWLGLGGLLAIVPAIAHAEFTVKQVRAEHLRDQVLVSADLELNLTAEAESALENGVPLVVLTEFNVLRTWPFWNETLASYQSRLRLRYHTLSDRYIVESLDAADIETFRSVGDALKRMGRIRALVVKLPSSPPLGDSDLFVLAVRSRLDVGALPPPLRPLAFFSPDWRLSSEWTQWQIEH